MKLELLQCPGGLKAGAVLVGETGKHGPSSLRKKKVKNHPGNFKNLWG